MTGELTATELTERVFGITGRTPAEAHEFVGQLEALVKDVLTCEDRTPADHSDVAAIATLVASQFGPAGSLDGVDLPRVLTHKRGNCVELSLILVLVGKLLDLPIRAVRVPRHMFVRVVHAGAYRNVETMTRGTFVSDEQYVTNFGVQSRQVEAGLFLQELTDSELLAEVVHKSYYKLLSTGGKLTFRDRRALREALLAHPKCTDLLNSLSLRCLLLGRPVFAERLLRRSLQLDPDNLPMVNNLVQSLVSQGKYAEAITVAEHFNECVPLQHNPLLLRNLGRAYIRVGNYDSAEWAYRSLERIFASTDWPVEQQLILPYLSCLYYFRGEYDKSVAKSLAWAQLAPENAIGSVWAASALWRSGETGPARRILSDLSGADPYLSALGRALCRLKEGETLLEQFPERAAESHSYLGEFWAPVELPRAIGHWQQCVDREKVNTFQYLRGVRNLADSSII